MSLNEDKEVNSEKSKTPHKPKEIKDINEKFLPSIAAEVFQELIDSKKA
jgi:hypothetical protein